MPCMGLARALGSLGCHVMHFSTIKVYIMTCCSLFSGICISVHFTQRSKERCWKQIGFIARTMHVLWIILQQSWSRFPRATCASLSRSCFVFFLFCYGSCCAEVKFNVHYALVLQIFSLTSTRHASFNIY